jgi:hypothetical protein
MKNLVDRLESRDVSAEKGATLEREAAAEIRKLEKELYSIVKDANRWNRLMYLCKEEVKG